MCMQKNAFTLIELLVVIAIIGILSSILLVAINPKSQIDKAKTAKILKEMDSIKNAVFYYVLDTGEFPPKCRLDCTEDTDPFLTNVSGASGWSGPYMQNGLWNRKHPWGGHLGLFLYDSNGNGRPEVWLILDDDAPGTDYSDNSGKIPVEVLAEIDKNVDDNDLDTGSFFLGNSSPFAEGEGAWRVYRVGEGN